MFAHAGAKVLLVARTAEAASELAESLADLGQDYLDKMGQTLPESLEAL